MERVICYARWITLCNSCYLFIISRWITLCNDAGNTLIKAGLAARISWRKTRARVISKAVRSDFLVSLFKRCSLRECAVSPLKRERNKGYWSRQRKEGRTRVEKGERAREWEMIGGRWALEGWKWDEKGWKGTRNDRNRWIFIMRCKVLCVLQLSHDESKSRMPRYRSRGNKMDESRNEAHKEMDGNVGGKVKQPWLLARR